MCNLSFLVERLISGNRSLASVETLGGRGEAEAEHRARADQLELQPGVNSSDPSIFHHDVVTIFNELWLPITLDTHLKHVAIPEPSVFRGRVGVNLTVKDDPVPLGARHLSHLRLHELGAV